MANGVVANAVVFFLLLYLVYVVEEIDRLEKELESLRKEVRGAKEYERSYKNLKISYLDLLGKMEKSEGRERKKI